MIVNGDASSIALAAEFFFSKTADEVAAIATDTMLAYMRTFVATMTGHELTQGAFARQVQEQSMADLLKMGLTIVSFAVRDVQRVPAILQA